MAQYKVAWNGTTREARVLPAATATPDGFVSAGTFYHDADGGADTEANDALDFRDSHAVYHHVRDLLYKLVPSVQNMQTVKITVAGATIVPPDT